MTAFKDWLNGLTSKTTPVDADELYVRDSSGTPGSKKLTWANLKATLLTYFDTAYLKLTGGTLSGGTVTASTPVLTVNQTWNNAGTTFVGKVTNITNAASAPNSLIEEWKYDGVARFRIHINGAVSFGTYASLTQTPDQTGLLCVRWDGFNGLVSLNANSLYASTEIGFRAGGQWGGVTNTPDAVLARDAANTLAQRNGANAQTSRLYGTYTDSSNYRRLTKTMSTAGVAEIKPEGAGTGASGNVLHISGLPTSNPGAGILWNDSGTVKVGT